MRTIRRVARAALLAALVLATACERDAALAKRKPPALAAPPPDPPAPSAPALAEEIAETLRSVHEEKLPVRAPRVASQRLDFGSGRLAQAAASRVIFRDTERGDSITEPEIGAVRAIAHGSDGSLFAIGATRGVRLLPRMNNAKSFPAPIFLPDATVLADLADPSHFFIFLPRDQQLYQYSFESEAGAFLPPDERFAFTGCTGALGWMRDGAFVCGTDSGLARKAPRGPRTTSTWPAAAQRFRLLAAKRLDELFAIDLEGDVQHLRWAGNVQLLGHFQLPALPYAAVSNGEALAFVLVSAPSPSEPRRWSLLVTDFEGQTRFQCELAAKPASVGDDWLAAVVEDKNLAISAFQPLVAVGGASQVAVWNYAEGRQVFAR